MGAARRARGWRLEDLSRQTGCSKPLLSNIEHGYVPQPSTKDRIAAALECTTQALWPPQRCPRCGLEFE